MWKVKSKAMYGVVQQKVDQVKAMPAHQKANLAAAEEAAASGGALAVDKSNPLAGHSAAQGHQLAIRKAPTMPKPAWHAPWKLFRVISGHMGWVRSVAVEPGNEWFATGAADRTIKIWDLASGKLKLTLTGHVP